MARFVQKWPQLVNWLNGGFISIYKIAGFVILFAIVFGMSAYLLTSGFYLVSRSWAVPSVLSPTSDKVVAAHSEYLYQVEQLNRQEADLQSQQRELELVRTHRQRYETYAGNLAQSVQSEIKKFESELGSIRKFLSRNPAGESKKVSADVRAQLDQLKKQYQSKLISQEQYMKGMMDANRLSKSQFDDGQFIKDLKQRATSLANIISESTQPDKEFALSRFVASVFATGDLELIDRYQIYLNTANRQEELTSREEQIQSRLQTLKDAIAQLRDGIKRIEGNPNIRASEQTIYTAFVPYENLKNVAVGDGVYGCYLHFVLCRRVGDIASRFPSEVMGKHPMSGGELRGQLIELKMTLPEWAEARTLFVGRPPLFL